MLFVKETVRLYKTKENAHHGKGALERFGWEIRSIEEIPVPGDKRKRKVWQIHAVKGWGFVIALLDAWEKIKSLHRQISDSKA